MDVVEAEVEVDQGKGFHLVVEDLVSEEENHHHSKDTKEKMNGKY